MVVLINGGIQLPLVGQELDSLLQLQDGRNMIRSMCQSAGSCAPCGGVHTVITMRWLTA